MSEEKMEIIQNGGKDIKVWTDIKGIEPAAIDQLYRMSRLPFVYDHIAVMPDVHVGKGATVGSVIATKGAIIPAAVGVDIGCGMLAAKTNLNASNLPDSLGQLRDEIEKIVPVGRASHKDTKYGKDLDFNKLASYKDLPSKVIDRAMTQIGTLGGGNHFIEICLDQNNDVWIMLHSGSRNIGNEVASLYISKAKGEMKKFFINLEDPDLAYLSEQTDQFKNYVNDLFWCQEYAMKNRQIMFENVFKALKRIFPAVELIGEVTSCHHNYVSIENHFGENVYVTRKGAIKADKGDIGIIPGSMGTKSYIVKGRGNADSFNSCSHGAGRKMSRTKAKSLYTYRDLIEQTKGVECRKDSGVVDEIPAAYKDIDTVMNNQSDLVDITAVLKQIVCVKG
ncbi:RtcB family protein [bacterium]|nr:MAG: RtcB family protein [bacterium]